MNDQTPPNSQHLAALEKPARCNAWIPRLATAFGSSLILAMGSASALAEPAADAPQPAPVTSAAEETADPAALAELDAQMDSLYEKLAMDLDARVRATTDAVVRRATDQQIAALQVRNDRMLGMSRGNSERIALELAALTAESRADSYAAATKPGERSHNELLAQVDAQAADGRIESGSLELPSDAQPHGRKDRVETRHHRFQQPFQQAPRVALGMRAADRPRSERPPVALRVVHVDEDGFDYEIRTWGSSSVTDLTADWVAYAHDASRPASAR